MDRQEAASILEDVLWKEQCCDAWFPDDDDDDDAVKERNLEHEALQFAIDYLSDSCNR